MNDGQGSVERSREPRYATTHGLPIRLYLQRPSNGCIHTIDGELLDLTRGGAKVLVSAELRFSDVIAMHIEIPELAIEIEVTSEVCWVRPTDDHKCLVGCVFTPKISMKTIDRLAVAGIIDRRQHRRCKVKVSGCAHWELDSQSFPVTIENCSVGGFRMVSGRPGYVGETVRVEIIEVDSSTLTISGRVCWQLERDGTYVIGCMSKSSEDFAHLRRLGAPHENEESPSALVCEARVHRAWVWCATSAFLLVACTVFGLSAKATWQGDAKVDLARHTQPGRTSAGHVRSGSTPPFESMKAESTGPPSLNGARTRRQSEGSRQAGAPRPTGKVVQPRQTEVQAPGSGATGQDFESQGDATAESVTASQAGALDVGSPDSPPFGGRPGSTAVDLSDGLQLLPFAESLRFLRRLREAPGPSSDSHPERHAESANRTPNAITVASPTATHQDRAAPVAARQKSSGFVETRRATTVSTEVTTTTSVDADPDLTRRASRMKEALIRGGQFYRAGHYSAAAAEYRTAAENVPSDPRAYYLWALSLYQLDDMADAERLVRKAVSLERWRPIENWGQWLTRYQGRARLWLERHRSALQRNRGP